jgi:hypothetical protein
MLRTLILVALVVSTLTTSAQTDPTRKSTHDPELEQDYGPGFWDADRDTTVEDTEGGETNTDLPTPDQIDKIQRESFLQILKFPQTIWNECTAVVTGNYQDAKCAPGRNISEILNEYLQQKFIACVDAGLASQGGGTANVIHITHAGITADANHSPKSLHAVNRAIDVKVINVQLTDGNEKQFTYSKTGNRPFYTGLRKCWGAVVHNDNGCPYYANSPGLTGSIGWENSSHGHHMHLSVPYCVNGQYGAYYWRK